MANPLEFRIVEQNRDVKITKRDVLWQHETRKPGAQDFDASRVVTVYGTDESVDRHNTKIRVDGWDFGDYRKNPTILWLHNMDESVPKMPIGSCIGITREEYARADAKEGQENAKRLAFDVEFPKRGTWSFADLACDMWKQGHLRAASVGFRNIEKRELNSKRDKEEMEKDGYDLTQPWAAELTKNALLELSLVPVGSNPNALAKAIREAAPEEFRAIFDHPEAEEEIDERWIGLRLEALRVALETPEEIVTPASTPADERGTAASPVGEEGALGEEGIEDWDPIDAEDDDGLNDEIERELAAMDEIPTPEYDPAGVKEFQDNIKTQLKQLCDEIKMLRDEVKILRGAAPVVTPAVTPTEPVPSALDLILDENIENLERMASLVRAK